jgi:hypothetical protein
MAPCVRHAWLPPSKTRVKLCTRRCEQHTAFRGASQRYVPASTDALMFGSPMHSARPIREKSIMRLTPSGIEVVLPHLVLGTSVLSLAWTAYGAIFWESFALAASALYQIAVIMLCCGNKCRFAVGKEEEAGRDGNIRLFVVVVLLIPSPFLAGGAIHAFNHVSNLLPSDLMPLAICAFTAGALRALYGCLLYEQRGAMFVVKAAVALLPFVAPLVVVGLIAAGFDNVDAVTGIALVLILLLGVLAPQVVHISRLFN